MQLKLILIAGELRLNITAPPHKFLISFINGTNRKIYRKYYDTSLLHHFLSAVVIRIS